MVSRTDSPFDCEEDGISKLITSADSLLAAISNVVLVLVLFSKNKLHTVFPLKSGTFLISRLFIFKKESAKLKILNIRSSSNPSVVRR